MRKDHPIELCRYQVANCYMRRRPLISGCKAFQRTIDEGIRLLNLIQDVYLDKSITIA